MNDTRADKQYTIAGIVVTVIATVVFIWAGVQWCMGYNRPGLSTGDKQSNEIQTFKNLVRIINAQKKYIQKDWDQDGKRVYASFFIHLFQSVDLKGEPIPVGLIPRELGFAMGSSNAISGYYFIDLFSRESAEQGRTQKMDYEKEWVIAAVPASLNKMGTLIFVADNSGHIFVKEFTDVSTRIPLQYPFQPLLNGWKKIETVQELRGLVE